jgi:hypothetical protein
VLCPQEITSFSSSLIVRRGEDRRGEEMKEDEGHPGGEEEPISFKATKEEDMMRIINN